MWILDKLRITGRDSTKATEVKAVAKAYNDILGGVLLSKLSDEKTVSSKLLEANKEWVYRNNDVIAKEVAQIDFVLYNMKLTGGQVEYEEIDSHPLLDLLDRFNPATTKADAIYATASHKKLTGDSFWLKDRNGAEIQNLFLLQPDKVELDLGDPTDASDDLIEGYIYKDTIDGKEIQKRYQPDQVIHFKTPNPKNMFRGYGAVEAAAETIDLDNLTTHTTRNFFVNGAISNFVLSTEAKLNEDQLKRLQAELKAAYGGAGNAYKTLILGGGLKPEKLSLTNKEMEFLGQLEWYRDKIMVIFGNTKASLGIIDDVNRASHESSIIAWKRNAVKPEMQAICDTLNEWLVPDFGENLILGFKDPIPEDRDAKLKEVKEAVTLDIITPNEARELLGYEARENEVNDQLSRENPVIPPALENVDVERVLRQRGFYDKRDLNIQMKDAARVIARKILKSRKHKTEEPRVITQEHEQFTNDKVWGYWGKQIKIVDIIEERFENKAKQFIETLEREAVARVAEEVNRKKGTERKELYDEDELLVKAELDFMPLLMEQVVAAGQQAYKLIDLDEPYIPFKVREAVQGQVRKFAISMIDTDQDKLAGIISSGIEEGRSIAEIERSIREEFVNIKKNQSKLVTRTEVIRTSNMAAVDAFEQSGVVEAKQWLTAQDDRVDYGDPNGACAQMNGKIIPLNGKFIKKGEEFAGRVFNYESVKWPPMHPNCRCVVLPVLVNQKAFEPVPTAERDVLQKKIEELESQVDKRTKAFKSLKAEHTDDKAYIKSLERLSGIADEPGRETREAQE